MEFRVFVKSVKADVAKKELTLTFVARLNGEVMDAAEALAIFAQPESPAVDMVITPLQKMMAFLESKNKEEEESEQ